MNQATLGTIDALSSGDKKVTQNQPSAWMSVPIGPNTAAGVAAAPTRKEVTPQYMAHFVTRSEQPNATSTFYQQLLGADEFWEAPFIRFLTFDEEHHRVGVATASGGKKTPVAQRIPNSVD